MDGYEKNVINTKANEKINRLGKTWRFLSLPLMRERIWSVSCSRAEICRRLLMLQIRKLLFTTRVLNLTVWYLDIFMFCFTSHILLLEIFSFHFVSLYDKLFSDVQWALIVDIIHSRSSDNGLYRYLDYFALRVSKIRLSEPRKLTITSSPR